MSILAPERAIAKPGYNRWLVPPAALALHLAIGQVYAFSVLKTPLQEHFSASHTAIGWVFSLAIVVLGLTAAFGGPWIAKQGPRKAMVLAAVLWVSGYAVAALGVSLDQLLLVYLGYGVIGGMGLGIGYVAPVATLMRWFPDRPGLATGMAVMGFGGGALLASPLATAMLNAWGDTPAEALAPTLLALAGINAVLMLWGAAVIREPASINDVIEDDGMVDDGHGGRIALAGTVSTTPGQALRSPQFWLLWWVFFVNITAGIGILEQAAPMIQTFFGQVTVGAAAGFVGVLSLANLSGRFAWSTISDSWGRPKVMALFVAGGAIIYSTLALVGSSAVIVFVLLAFVQITFYGGGFSTVPAYLKDLFGPRYLSVILGAILTAWSCAGVAGPLIVNGIVDSREAAGIVGAERYQPALWVVAALLVTATVAALVLARLAKKETSDHE